MRFGLKALFGVVTIACIIAAFPMNSVNIAVIIVEAALGFGALILFSAGVILVSDYFARGLSASTEIDDPDDSHS